MCSHKATQAASGSGRAFDPEVLKLELFDHIIKVTRGMYIILYVVCMPFLLQGR